MNGPCLYCTRLSSCKKATPRMVELLEGCGLFEPTSEPVVLARARVIELLGADAVTKKRGKANMSASEKTAVASRKSLRAFAVKIGAVTQGSSYRLQAQDLVDAITSVTDDDGNPLYPDAASMTDDQLSEIGEAEKKPAKKPAKKKVAAQPEEAAEEKPKPTRKRRARKKKPEPEPEVVPEEEAAPEPAKKAPAAGRKRRSRAAAAAPQADNKAVELLTDMVKDIGVMVEKQGKQVSDLTDTVTGDEASLVDKIASIEAFLCWMYNTEYNEGNEISSLDEVTWS